MDNLPLTKTDIDKLVAKWWAADGHEFPDWMSYHDPFNEVRYDYDSSKICYSLIREFKPVNCFEFGTSFGHSLLFGLDALKKNGKPFNYLAFEAIPDLYQKSYDNVMRRFGEIPEGLNLVREDVLTTQVEIPEDLDYAFIDSNHERESTEWYLKNVFPKIKKGGLVAIHDLAIFEDEQGEWKSKADLGHGGVYEEMYCLFDLQKKGELPLEKIYWMYPDADKFDNAWEGTFWVKK